MAQHVYYVCITTCLGALLVLLLMDLHLSASNEATITDWLRGHPAEWWIPAGLTTAILVGVSIHLFLRR